MGGSVNVRIKCQHAEASFAIQVARDVALLHFFMQYYNYIYIYIYYTVIDDILQ